MQKNESEKAIWDKKKIIISVVLIIILFFVGFKAKELFLDINTSKSKINNVTKSFSESVKGINTQIEDKSSKEDSYSNSSIADKLQSEAQKKLEAIKEEVTKLNVLDVATSSPQVKKIMNDLKSLEEYPGNQAKEMCQQICKSL